MHHHAQIEDVAEWLAEMGRRADWMSNDMRSTVNIADVREKWEKRLKDPKDGPKEADKLAARKHRLVALFRSANCYSANVHACTNYLGELVDELVRLNRVPGQASVEGLQLLVQAWDEHRRPQKDGLLHTARASRSGLFRWLHRAARPSKRKCM